MNKKNINPLLDNYYRGETSKEQEKELRDAVNREEDLFQEEQLIFEYYEEQAIVPENLESKIFDQITEKSRQRKMVKTNWFKYTSMAAAVCLFASVFWFNHVRQTPKGMSEEDQFAVLEQALLNVSSNVKPPENEEVLILFEDKNLEIVVN